MVWSLLLLLLYCFILQRMVVLSKGHLNPVFNFACFFAHTLSWLSTFRENILVACIKPITAVLVFVFLLTLPTNLQERRVCLFLWYFNCSLCKLNYARNSMWTFYQNKYLASAPTPLVASVSFPQRDTRLGAPLCFATLTVSSRNFIAVKSFRKGWL